MITTTAQQPLEGVIRLALPEDLDGVEQGYDELLLHEEQNGSTTNWKRGLYPTRAFAENALREGTLYVLRENGGISASMVLNTEQAADYQKIDWKYPAGEKEALVIHTLVIPPSQARRGLGQKMVAFALEQARAMGCASFRLDTSARNEPARRLYERCGFRYAGKAEVLHQGVIPGELIFLEHNLRVSF